MVITIYTDGACSGNPGPGGWAAILVTRDATGTVLSEQAVSDWQGHTTNNRCEIRAAILGLSLLSTPTPVTVISDSKYLIRTMNGEYKRRTNHDLWALLDQGCVGHTITWEWILGHNGDPYNDRVDALAVAARRKAQGGK